MQTTETIYYLEMLSPAEMRPARDAAIPFDLRRAEIPCPELSRFFYTAVGGDWKWVDRLDWTYSQWLEYVTQPGYELWVASVSGTPAGYFELDDDRAGDVEIVFFGLVPQFVGSGIGGALLNRAIERAWAKPARRVWLHTCSFDHPSALPNYLARGFRLNRKETQTKDMPEAHPGPWPGAAKTAAMTRQLGACAQVFADGHSACAQPLSKQEQEKKED